MPRTACIVSTRHTAWLRGWHQYLYFFISRASTCGTGGQCMASGRCSAARALQYILLLLLAPLSAGLLGGARRMAPAAPTPAQHPCRKGGSPPAGRCPWCRRAAGDAAGGRPQRGRQARQPPGPGPVPGSSHAAARRSGAARAGGGARGRACGCECTLRRSMRGAQPAAALHGLEAAAPDVGGPWRPLEAAHYPWGEAGGGSSAQQTTASAALPAFPGRTWIAYLGLGASPRDGRLPPTSAVTLHSTVTCSGVGVGVKLGWAGAARVSARRWWLRRGPGWAGAAQGGCGDGCCRRRARRPGSRAPTPPAELLPMPKEAHPVEVLPGQGGADAGKGRDLGAPFGCGLRARPGGRLLAAGALAKSPLLQWQQRVAQAGGLAA